MSTGDAAIAVAAVLVGSLLKSISGLGLPLVSIPAISYVAGIDDAVAVTALPNLVLNAALAWRVRSSWGSTRDLPVLGGFGFLGAIAGTVLLVSLPEEPLIALLVAVVAAYVVVYFVSPTFSVGPVRSRRLAPLVGSSAGAMQGAVGISGPVVASWIHSYRLERDANILSVTFLFTLASIAQLPALAIGGKMVGLWWVSALACIPALAVIPLGSHLRGRLSSTGFERFVIAMLAAGVIGLAIRTFG